MSAPKDIPGETLDRVRRIEIRLTRLMEGLNIETGIHRPTWSDGTILVPSHASSLADCLKVIPSDWPSEMTVKLVMSGQFVGVFSRI